ncbi:MAG: hypothetical protein IKH16_09670, partial [Selenomonadaceae bacterium]|nr:hypothetical protein [Selenomonadaceae bacterium]
MEKTDRTIALFGDCVTHMVGLPYRHTRAVGLTNWLSIVSPMTEHFSRLDMGQLEPLTLNNYEKRICLLNANKKFLEFLLEEKADFLVLDCMDCRKGILLDSPDAQGKAACITSNDYMRDFGKTLKIMFGEAGRYRYVPATEIDRASYAEAAAR